MPQMRRFANKGADMKKLLLIAALVVAGAVVYTLVTQRSDRELWDEVYDDF